MMGLEGYNDLDGSKWMEKILKDAPGFPDLEYLKRKDVHRFEVEYPRIAFSEQIEDPDNMSFPTPTGKIEIFSYRFDDMKDPLIPPIPKYIPTWEGRDHIKTKDYPIQLITPHSARRINSQLDNIDQVKREEDDLLWMNPLDAEARNIKDGDVVLVYNDRGKVRTKARVTDRIMKGVASLDAGQWYRPDKDGTDEGGSANVLTLDRMSPAGAFTSNTSLVQVEKI
jgi:anaerobic dimethyl sulfoxide reductase subunit A